MRAGAYWYSFLTQQGENCVFLEPDCFCNCSFYSCELSSFGGERKQRERSKHKNAFTRDVGVGGSFFCPLHRQHGFDQERPRTVRTRLDLCNFCCLNYDFVCNLFSRVLHCRDLWVWHPFPNPPDLANNCRSKSLFNISTCMDWRVDFLPCKAKIRRHPDGWQGFLTQSGRKIRRQDMRGEILNRLLNSFKRQKSEKQCFPSCKIQPISGPCS